MADVKISQLLLMDSPASLPLTNAISDSDELIVNDISSLITKRVKIEDVLLLRNRNIDDTADGSQVTGNLNVTGGITFGTDLEDGLGNTITDLSTLVTNEELTTLLETLLGTDGEGGISTLSCLRDSAPTRSGYGCGVTVDGELTVDSDLYVRGIIYGDGSGITNIQFAERAGEADSAYHSILSDLANSALTADFANAADSADHARESLCTLNVNLRSATEDQSYYLHMSASQTGCDSTETSENLLYNPVTDVLSSGFFAGDGSLLTNITASNSQSDEINSNIATVNAPHYILFKETATGYDSALTDASLLYHPITNTILDPNGDLFLYGTARTATKMTASAASGSNFVMLRNLGAGDSDSCSVSSGLTFNASTETLNASFFNGDGSSISNVDAVTATTATNVTVTAVSDNSTYYMHFGSAVSGGDGVNVDADIRYNPSENKLSLASDTNAMTFGADSDLSIYHDGSNAYIDTRTGGLNITSSTGTTVVVLDNLPTTDPINAGQLWNDLGTLKISSGI